MVPYNLADNNFETAKKNALKDAANKNTMISFPHEAIYSETITEQLISIHSLLNILAFFQWVRDPGQY